MSFMTGNGALFAACILLGTASVATAEQLPAMLPEASVEANHVTLSLNRWEGNRGTLSVVGCQGCPLYFGFDHTTLFMLNGEPIPLPEAITLSGTAGTVIFERGTRRLRRVIW